MAFHSSCYGVVNTSKAFKCNVIQTSDGTIMQAKIIWNIPVMQHNKSQMKAKRFLFSLFSMSNSVNEVWTLHDDINALDLRKGNNEVNFDIIITTKNEHSTVGY